MNGQDALHIVQWAQQQLVQFGRLGATRILKVPDLPAAIAAGANVQVQAPLLKFNRPGTVIGLYAQELAGTLPKFAQTGLRLQFAGDDDLIYNGAAGDFASLLALVGFSVNWFPMMRRVDNYTQWTITYRNQDPGATATPSCMFAVLEDSELANVAAEMKEAQARAGRI